MIFYKFDTILCILKKHLSVILKKGKMFFYMEGARNENKKNTKRESVIQTWKKT